MMRIILLLTLFLSSCTLLQRKIPVKDLIPRETDIPGWSIQDRDSAVGTEKAGSLDPLFLEYGALEMARTDYRLRTRPAITVRVIVIRCRSSLDCFGVFSRERELNAPERREEQYYSAGQSIFIWKGDIYAKALMSGGTGSELDIFREVLHKNIRSQGGWKPLPKFVKSLDPAGSTRYIVYYKKGHRNIPGSQDLFLVNRQVLQKTRLVFYMKKARPIEAEREYNDLLKQGSGGFILVKTGSFPMAMKFQGNSGYCVLSYVNNWIFGIFDAENITEGTRLIELLRHEVRAWL